jgi:hypothetical protein
MEKRWLAVAQSYDFTQRLKHFTAEKYGLAAKV